MHYYQFNIGDYATHTRHLSIYEDIAYRRLLDWYYLNEKPLPADYTQCAKLILMKNRAPDVDCVLTEFFTLTENGWINKRADSEIAKFKEFSLAGKRGAAKRWSKGGDSHPIAPPIANNNHKPITNNQDPIKEHAAAFALPDWIDKTQWDLWMKTRKGKKMIAEQMQAQVDKLCKWRDSGLDHCGALANAAANGYTGLFLPDSGKSRKTPAPENFSLRDYGQGVQDL